MRTKSQQSSSFIRSILIITLILMTSQAIYSQSVLSGLGVEIGGGYNQLFWQYPLPLPLSNDSRYDRTQFALTLEARLKYDIGISENFNCIPFVGYNRFGGKSEDSPVLQNGMKLAQSSVWFDAFEAGLFIAYTISDFSFGIGYKANRHLKIMDWMSIPNVLSGSDINSSYNVTSQYRPWSHDAGLRISYRMSHYIISTESWFGISGLEGDGDLSKMNIRQNHFRLLLGYTL